MIDRFNCMKIDFYRAKAGTKLKDKHQCGRKTLKIHMREKVNIINFNLGVGVKLGLK